MSLAPTLAPRYNTSGVRASAEREQAPAGPASAGRTGQCQQGQERYMRLMDLWGILAHGPQQTVPPLLIFNTTTALHSTSSEGDVNRLPCPPHPPPTPRQSPPVLTCGQNWSLAERASPLRGRCTRNAGHRTTLDGRHDSSLVATHPLCHHWVRAAGHETMSEMRRKRSMRMSPSDLVGGREAHRPAR